MKALLQTPAQPGPVQPAQWLSGSVPHWAELPLVRQQELITILASLLLRHWPKPAPEVSDDPQL